MTSSQPAPSTVINQLKQAFKNHVKIPRHFGGVPNSQLQGLLYYKAYELHVLITLIQKLSAVGRTFHWMGQKHLILNASHGPRDSTKNAYIEVRDSGQPIAEIWTDLEVVSLSHIKSPPAKGYLSTASAAMHELDVVVIRKGIVNGERPRPADVLLAAEAKYTTYGKNLLKALLGVRRETAYFSANPVPTHFGWPKRKVPASTSAGSLNPCSHWLVSFCHDPAIKSYAKAGAFFGVHMDQLLL